MKFSLLPAGLFVGLLPVACAAPVPEAAGLILPAGFTAEVLVADVPNARSMTWGSGGTLFIGTRRAGKVYAVRGALGDAPEVW